jgi:hypothetical protein
LPRLKNKKPKIIKATGVTPVGLGAWLPSQAQDPEFKPQYCSPHPKKQNKTAVWYFGKLWSQIGLSSNPSSAV